MADYQACELNKIRSLMEELANRLYWQWILRFVVWETHGPTLVLAAKFAGMRTTIDTSDVLGPLSDHWYRRDIVVVPSLAIRCEPTPPDPRIYL